MIPNAHSVMEQGQSTTRESTSVTATDVDDVNVHAVFCTCNECTEGTIIELYMERLS